MFSASLINKKYDKSLEFDGTYSILTHKLGGTKPYQPLGSEKSLKLPRKLQFYTKHGQLAESAELVMEIIP